MTEDKFENQPIPEEERNTEEEQHRQTPEAEVTEKPASDAEFSVDELIRSTRDDLERYDALVGTAPSEEEPSDRPSSLEP